MTKNVAKSKNLETEVGSRYSAEIRKEHVFKMSLMGFTISRMAQALKVSKKTIERDKKELQQEQLERLKQLRKEFNAERYFFERVEELKLMKYELWRIADDHRGSGKVSAINMMLKVDKEIEKLYERWGLLSKEPVEKVISILKVIHEYPDKKSNYNQNTKQDETKTITPFYP